MPFARAPGAIQGTKGGRLVLRGRGLGSLGQPLVAKPRGVAKQLGKDQTIVLGAGLARIGVAPQVATIDWKTYKEQSGVPAKIGPGDL